MVEFVSWLRGLAEKGGKGVVNNIDARCLGRVADDLERYHRRIVVLEMVIREELGSHYACHDDANAMIVDSIMERPSAAVGGAR